MSAKLKFIPVISLLVILSVFLIGCQPKAPVPDSQTASGPAATNAPEVTAAPVEATPNSNEQQASPTEAPPTPTNVPVQPGDSSSSTPTSLPEEESVPTTAVPAQAEQPTQTPAAETEAQPAETAGTPQATEPAATPATEGEGQAGTAESCVNKGVFVADLTIPDDTLLPRSESFQKVWRILNAGTCTWDSDYHLVFHSGDMLNGPREIVFPLTRPGETADIAIDLKSPPAGGTYTSYWELRDLVTGERFGVGVPPDVIWARIAVTYVDSSGQGSAGGQGSGGGTETGGTGGGGSTEGGVAAVAPSGGCQAQVSPDTEALILSLINSGRAASGLPPYKLDASLTVAARVHSQDMACNNYVSHTGTDGSTWTDRVAAQGYPYSVAHENIYVGNPDFGGTAQGAYTWWMNSQVHRDNILNPDLYSIGVGYVFNPDSEYYGYYTVVFTRP